MIAVTVGRHDNERLYDYNATDAKLVGSAIVLINACLVRVTYPDGTQHGSWSLPESECGDIVLPLAGHTFNMPRGWWKK